MIISRNGELWFLIVVVPMKIIIILLMNVDLSHRRHRRRFRWSLSVFLPSLPLMCASYTNHARKRTAAAVVVVALGVAVRLSIVHAFVRLFCSFIRSFASGIRFQTARCCTSKTVQDCMSHLCQLHERGQIIHSHTILCVCYCNVRTL